MLDTEYKMIAMIPRVERGELIEIREFRVFQSCVNSREKKNLDHSKINFVSIFIKTKYYVHESRCVQFINSFTLR